VAILRIAFVGWGAINSHVGALLKERRANIEVVGIATRTRSHAATPAQVPFLDNPARLAEIKPDLVVEAAGRAAVEIWAPSALRYAKALVVASTSAFCDEALLPRLREIAQACGSRILIPPGAIGAIDALAAAATLTLDEVVHQIVKPPQGWKGTAAENLIDLDHLPSPRIFFTGSAREAAQLYPQNANATVVTSLAGIGLDRTRVELVADPYISRNQHHITVRGAFGNFEIMLQNEPLRTNSKSSELAALSLVHLIEMQADSVII
jgi:aspartate dehydrogenase